MADRSPFDDLPRPLAVAVHDAGAANMIAAWAAAAETPPERVIAKGPALSIWQQRFGEDTDPASDPAALDDMACLISGTGWASDLEHRARIAAARANVRSIAVLDHWVNYAARFRRDGHDQLPDAIWVGDDEARRIAEATFPALPVKTHPNLYPAEQARGAGPKPKDGDILFLLEPARSDWGRGAPGEFQALDFLLARREAAGIPLDAPVRLRPHPSDPPGKYADWIAAHEGARLDTSPDMASALREARWVAGLNSMGLVIALAAGRRVISALPAHAPACVLPQTDILRLADV
ncbi:MAG: hypothetical protein QNI87_07685 [Erythrobacter sp.]|uniref:hypothetical protein n=1 Tax=Erythrobacter sp. TaxID=1042 RepID=UPI0026022BFC|nr:hypothetical protein [Erythrobacter sp.]MDJ0978402.1 hypothetical protein [Erythrobacter sp.]